MLFRSRYKLEEEDDNSKIFKNSIFYIELRVNLFLYWSVRAVVIRPCFEGHSIYRLLLYKLKTLVCLHEMYGLEVDKPLPENIRILEGLGFTYISGTAQMRMNSDALSKITAKDWGLEHITDDACSLIREGSLPTADDLNNQDFVNQKYRERLERRAKQSKQFSS